MELPGCHPPVAAATAGIRNAVEMAVDVTQDGSHMLSSIGMDNSRGSQLGFLAAGHTGLKIETERKEKFLQGLLESKWCCWRENQSIQRSGPVLCSSALLLPFLPTVPVSQGNKHPHYSFQVECGIGKSHEELIILRLQNELHMKFGRNELQWD